MTKVVRTVCLLVVGALLALAVNAAVAAPNPENATGSHISQVKTKYGNISIGSTGPWVLVDKTKMTIPARTHAFFDVRPDVWGYCTGNASTTGSCLIRVLVNGVETGPTELEFVTEQDTSNGNSSDGQWMVERSSKVLGPGTYTIKVQHGAIGDPSTYFGITAWHVTFERVTV
jgi:hypothetical protein